MFQFREILNENTSTSAQSTKNSQPTLRESIHSNSMWKFDDSRATEFNYLIGEMLGIDNQPFKMVENEGFVRLMQKALPRYQVVLPEFNSFINQNEALHNKS